MSDMRGTSERVTCTYDQLFRFLKLDPLVEIQFNTVGARLVRYSETTGDALPRSIFDAVQVFTFQSKHDHVLRREHDSIEHQIKFTRQSLADFCYHDTHGSPEGLTDRPSA